MIIQEIVIVKDLKLKHTYSSTNKYIKQVETGVVYNEAYDTFKHNYTYIELDTEIEPEIIPEDIEAKENYQSI